MFSYRPPVTYMNFLMCAFWVFSPHLDSHIYIHLIYIYVSLVQGMGPELRRALCWVSHICSPFLKFLPILKQRPTFSFCTGSHKWCSCPGEGFENQNTMQKMYSGLLFLVIIATMDMNLSQLWEIVEDREVLCAEVHGVTKSRTWLDNYIRCV